MIMKRAMRIAGAIAALGGILTGARAAGDDPLLRPILPDTARQWLAPQEPFRLFGRTYLVGFEGLNVALIDTGKGLILVDGAVPQSVRAVEANIRALGFKVADIKYILSTEPHFDHSGGIPALARDSGATVLAGTRAIAALRSGKPDAHDPQATILPNQPGIARLRGVKDGEQIRLGDTVVTAIATPGHTAGSTSWVWRQCEGRQCASIVFAASINPVSADDYHFSEAGHRPIVEDFRRSFARMRSLPCDILLKSHPEQPKTKDGAARLARARTPNPFIDARACRAYADDRAAALEARLNREKPGT